MVPDDCFFMRYALTLAADAAQRGDVPVGAVLVKNGVVLAAASDVKSVDPTEHAEIIAIREAAKSLGHWNLTGCTLYVTLEPCPMCAGACVNARVSRVVYGARNYKSGAAGTLYNILRDGRLNHVCNVDGGVLEYECLKVLQEFFLAKRKKAAS